jgi:sugar lactone lactonase YvrE
MTRVEQITGVVTYHGEGPVWSARWGGLRWVDMLAELFITTSRQGLEPGDDPLAGALFRALPGGRGTPVREFAG